MTRTPPPPIRRENTSYERHGEIVDDPYLWLEAGGEKVDEWVDRQNAYADDSLRSIAVRNRLESRFESLARTTEYGTIAAAPTGYFQEVEAPEDDQPAVTVRETLADDRETLVDPNAFSEDATAAVGWWSVSPDGERLAYGVDEGGDEQYDIRVLEVDTGEVRVELPVLGRTTLAAFAWAPDGFYYMRTGTADEGGQLEKSIHYHEYGDDRGDDDRLYEIDEPSAWPVLATDRDGEHLLVSLVVGWERSEVFYADAGADEPEFTPVLTDTESLYAPLVRGDTAYLRTNEDAPYYRILELDLSENLESRRLKPDDLTETIPERDAIVRDATIADDRLIVQYERDAASELEVFDLAGDRVETIDLPGIGTVAGLSGNRDAPEVFFTYESFDRPRTVYRYDLDGGERERLDRPDVDLELDVDLTVDRVRYESADSAEVPMFLVHRADLARDGDNPALLYGYGGFENSLTPTFQTFAGEFLRSGGVYAVANLRGGGEFGKEWHEAARHEKKQRTFDDMIAAAEWLIDRGYAASDRLAIRGGSNGGLTVGAVLTQRPDLIRAVCCHVPLLDMLRFHTFLLGASWTAEYGSPDDPEAYEYIKEYSPYHNVENAVRGAANGRAGRDDSRDEREFPAVFFTTAESDTRVHPVHAWKMTARLQAVDRWDRPIVCKTRRDTGHGTGKPTWMIVEEQLDVWSFLFDQLDAAYVEP